MTFMACDEVSDDNITSPRFHSRPILRESVLIVTCNSFIHQQLLWIISAPIPLTAVQRWKCFIPTLTSLTTILMATYPISKGDKHIVEDMEAELTKHSTGGSKHFTDCIFGTIQIEERPNLMLWGKAKKKGFRQIVSNYICYWMALSHLISFIPTFR
jgi:hypothetical protein